VIGYQLLIGCHLKGGVSMLSDQMVNVLLFLVLVMIVLTVLFYAIIFTTYSPDAPLVLGLTGSGRPESAVRGPSFTETPAYPPTWTLTPTYTPGPTHTPTETRTPTPTSTFTVTPTPIPSRTPTPTKTPLPTRTFTPAPSPTPLPWVVDKVETENNCEVVRVLIEAVGPNGVGMSGVQFEVGELNVAGSRFVMTTNPNGLAAWDNDPGEARTWFVAPLQDGQRMGELVTWQSDDEDVCDVSSAIQIYNITWRRLY
jgi:hypothetical protein